MSRVQDRDEKAQLDKSRVQVRDVKGSGYR